LWRPQVAGAAQTIEEAMADLDMEHYDSEDEDNIVSRALGGSSGTGARAGGGGGRGARARPRPLLLQCCRGLGQPIIQVVSFVAKPAKPWEETPDAMAPLLGSAGRCPCSRLDASTIIMLPTLQAARQRCWRHPRRTPTCSWDTATRTTPTRTRAMLRSSRVRRRRGRGACAAGSDSRSAAAAAAASPAAHSSSCHRCAGLQPGPR